jgi:hypothetical protein
MEQYMLTAWNALKDSGKISEFTGGVMSGVVKGATDEIIGSDVFNNTLTNILQNNDVNVLLIRMGHTTENQQREFIRANLAAFVRYNVDFQAQPGSSLLSTTQSNVAIIENISNSIARPISGAITNNSDFNEFVTIMARSASTNLIFGKPLLYSVGEEIGYRATRTVKKCTPRRCPCSCAVS